MLKTISFTTTEQIATISFNRPTAMNAFNDVMGEELKYVTDQVRTDNSIKVLILKGEGELFMAGGDIQFFYQALDTLPAGVMDIVRSLNAAILNLMHMPKPVIASVHGSVAGVGMSIMMACDLAMVAQQTKFTMAYTGIGISPDGGASYALPRLVGTKKAMEWLLLSEIFDAEVALQYGLINRVVPLEQLSASTHSIARRLVNGPSQSLAEIKKLVNQSWQNSLETQLELEGRAFEKCSATQDFKVGVTGFLKKQKPIFSGN